MPCGRYREAIADAAAGMPLPGDAEAHVAVCEACRSELRDLRQALALAETALRDLGSEEPDPLLRARIREAVAEGREASAQRRTRWWPGWGAAAATAVICVAAVIAWRTAAPSRPQEAASVPTPAAPLPAGADSDDPELSAEVSPGPEPGRSPTRGPDDLTVRPARGETSVAAPAAPRRGETEVLMPPGQTEAVVRFAVLILHERVAPAALMDGDRSSLDLVKPAPLEIQPLEIVPLDPAETPGT